ncbi:SDR family NAD(P)-dependent oxidoreductase [Pseudomonas lurida]|uniref:SDR family NAD(P)-dependent oxidoreductase n=1 Tax=Pseudomonas lurida TaxID=244566 RepID=UPI001CA40F3C|nr:SDR family NAD(P)-dependent oxidoreductase [Pseudomonas lurida]
MNSSIPDWRGRRVWVVGASSGIGAALATELLKAGARVAVSARSTDSLQALAHNHASAIVAPLDIVDVEAWGSQYRAICDQVGGVDLIVFCAADYQSQRSWEVTAASAARTLAVNLSSVYTGLATVLPDMLARGSGGVAIVASVAGYLGLPNASVYGPGKAALIYLAELLYLDLHPRGLDVYPINPGFVQTSLTAKNDFSMPALQTPHAAAQAIQRGLTRGAFEIHFPKRFTWAIKFFRMLPYRLRFIIMAKMLKTQ